MEYHKISTSHVPSRPAPVPEELVFPLLLHAGKPSEAIVKKGDIVKVGQLIAKAVSGISANVHSSVSGEVVNIKDYPHPLGMDLPAIIIKNDFQYTKIDAAPLHSIKDATKEDLLKMIFDAGIVGMGGAAFPTHIKLNPTNKIKELIINAAECEPYVTSDHRTIIEHTKKIFIGIEVMQKILEPAMVYIGIEDNKQDAIRALKNYSIQYKNIHVITLPTQYPQGAEKILVRQVTGKHVPHLPMEVGVVVVNVSTAAQIGMTATSGLPLIERIVTIAGDLLEKKHNLQVRIGTPIKYLLAELTPEKIQKISPFKILFGGPMMGLSQHNLDVPVLKGTTGILIMSNVVEQESTCLRCGRCVDNCPLYLMPVFAANKGIQAAECMECGLCAYNCPSKINLVQRIKLQKIMLAQKGKSK
ncbi:MAG: electron transport complex subunit RsxC [Candidatus Margulisbacteria bacterium]|nr:electron transport complex subunit RsxC [Candidatus Margulisiibacteriota bacterium]